MGKLAKNYAYNVAYQLLVLIAPLVTAPYLSRVLGAEALGAYAYINATGNVVATISLLGIYTYGNRQVAYVRDDRDALNKTFWELTALRSLLGVCGTLMYAVYAVWTKQYRSLFLVYYPYILAQFIDCSWLYVGLEDMGPAVLKNFLAKVTNIAGIFLLVRSPDDVWIYLLLLASTTFIGNVCIYTQLPKYVGSPSVNIRNIPIHIKGSLQLFLPQLAALFYLQVDKMMLQWITGDSRQISFYDQAEKIVTIPLSLITVISTVMMPRIANEYHKDNAKVVSSLLCKSGQFSLCLALPMAFGVLCVAQQLIPWYLGEEFAPSAITIMVLSPIILLNTLSGISGKQYFIATGQISILTKAYLSAAVLNVLINALLIPRYGFIGAAVATVMSGVLSVAGQYRYLHRQVELKDMWRNSVPYLFGALLMALVLVALTWKMKAQAWTTLLQVVIGIVVYFAYLVAIRDSLLKELILRIEKRRSI